MCPTLKSIGVSLFLILGLIMFSSSKANENKQEKEGKMQKVTIAKEQVKSQKNQLIQVKNGRIKFVYNR